MGSYSGWYMWLCWTQHLAHRGCTVMVSKAPSLTKLKVLLTLAGENRSRERRSPPVGSGGLYQYSWCSVHQESGDGRIRTSSIDECLLDISPTPTSPPTLIHKKQNESRHHPIKFISLPHQTEKTCPLPVSLSNKVQLLELRTPDTSHKESSSTTPITPT